MARTNVGTASPPSIRARLAALAPLWRLAQRHAVLIPIVALAAWLRFSNLGGEHLHGDEAEYAIVARYLSQDPLALLYPALSGASDAIFVSQPPLLLYLMAGSVALFGFTETALILPTALLGVATVAAVYAVGCRLGGRLHGAIAAALLAVLPFHVSMSRGTMLDVGYAFFLVVAAYFMVAWLQEQRLHQAVGAAIAGAAAALSKLPGVLVVPVLIIVLLAALVPTLARRALAGARTQQTHGAIAAAILLVGASAYLALLLHLDALDALRDKLLWNADRVAAGEPGQRSGIWDYFGVGPHTFETQLGGGVLALALVGLAFEASRYAARPEANRARVVLPALTLVLAAFFFTSERKIGFYLLPFAPLAALLVGGAAVGIRDLVSWAGIHFTRRDVRRLGPVATAIGVAAIAAPGYATLGDAVDEYEKDVEGSTFGYGIREAAWWIHEQDEDAAQYGTLLGRFTLKLYNDQPTYHRFVGEENLDDAVARGELRYLVYDEYIGKSEDTAVVANLAARWNGQEVARFERDWGWVQVIRVGPQETLP